MHRTARPFVLGLAVAVLLWPSVGAGAEEAKLTHEQLVAAGIKASKQDLAWWRDAKLGLFIHWGVGIEKRHAPWANNTDDGIYWKALSKNLEKVEKFDAAAWLKVVEESGAKYVIFVTRHSPGMQRRPGGNLHLWDTATSDNKLTHPKSPFRRDVCKEIADAAHKAGIKLFWYFPGPAGKDLDELLTNYGKVAGVWFESVSPPEGRSYRDLLRDMRRRQPGILTNGRVAGNPYGGDYDTPLHDPPLPGWYAGPVEVTANLHDGSWYWDRPNPLVKTFPEVVGLMMRCVGQGANLALNLAPAPSGAMERNETGRVKELGDWLKKYGKSVYGTRPGPYASAEWGVSTRKGRTVYIHMLQNLDKGTLALRPLNKKIVRSRLLTGGDVTVEQTSDALTITLPEKSVKVADTIIALELDGPAADAAVIAGAATSLAAGKKATAEHVFTWAPGGITAAMNGPQNAVDGDPNTAWGSRSPTRRQAEIHRWLEVDLGAPATIGRATVDAVGALGANAQGIQAFAIEYRKDGNWVRCFDSKLVRGAALERWTHKVTFEPVTAQAFRLGVKGRNTSVREFELFPPPGK